jgi:hypothetical protein
MKNYALLLIGLLLFATTARALEKSSSNPVDLVNQRVQQAVPYALDQTLQTFTKTVHGGVLHVIAKSADNSHQIMLIREDLLKMANEFRKGDFSRTERMHGAHMPGLDQLKKAQIDEIRFDYKILENGAQIHFSTEYPQFVDALHEWFDAQINDHGNEVIPEHSQHHLAPAE